MSSYMAQKTIRGYNLGEVSSALQKAVRRSDEEQATWWAAELDQSGHGKHAWNRMLVILSEDIGLAWVEGPAVITSLMRVWTEAVAMRKPNMFERLYVLHAAALLARAPKSRRLDHCLWATYGHMGRRFEIPDEALDMHTARGRAMQRGEEHFEAEGSKLVNEADLGPDPYKPFYDAGSEEAYAMQGPTPGSGPAPRRSATLFSATDK